MVWALPRSSSVSRLKISQASLTAARNPRISLARGTGPRAANSSSRTRWSGAPPSPETIHWRTLPAKCRARFPALFEDSFWRHQISSSVRSFRQRSMRGRWCSRSECSASVRYSRLMLCDFFMIISPRRKRPCPLLSGESGDRLGPAASGSFCTCLSLALSDCRSRLAARRPAGSRAASGPNLFREFRSPLGRFPIGEPEIECGVAAPASPRLRHSFHSRRIRQLAQTVEPLDHLLQTDVRGGQTVEMPERPQTHIMRGPWTDALLAQQALVGAGGLELAQAFEI